MKTSIHAALPVVAMATLLGVGLCASPAQENPDPGQSPDQAAVLQRVRTSFGRAMAIKNQALQQAKFREAKRGFSRELEASSSSPSLKIELLGLYKRIMTKVGDTAAASQAAQRQQVVARGQLGPADYASWLNTEVDRLRNQRLFDLAILHLTEAVNEDPDSQTAAQRSLPIGVINVQKAYLTRPYDAAIEQYGHVAERYATAFPDLADDARLRQAKTLWLNDQIAEAEALFQELGTISNETVAESARYYTALPEIMAARFRETIAGSTRGSSKAN